ncbi:MAG: hypoxanthine phosphoribosyltransferase [Cystobacterineae bacterium]|nr:hypoxanthine phosphoribosyltransferase [Cystobacterineae bacterium]
MLISETQLKTRVQEMAQEMTRDFQGKELTVVAVLKGALVFCSDLIRSMDLPLEMEVLGVSSYPTGAETTGEARLTFDLTKPLAGKHLLLVEDIVDTGLTVDFLKKTFEARQPASIRVCALLHKPSRTRVQVPIDYMGFSVEDHFLVGYGLDYEERYRNLPFIGVLNLG